MANSALAQTLWSQTVPLCITHTEHPNSPFITALPRFSYLALLLPRLSAFFNTAGPARVSSFHHEDVLLRNLPLGLLVDLYQPTLPWRLTVSDGASWDIGDTFLNCVKEADFVRYGTAKGILSLSKQDTSSLWNAVQDNDYPSFARVNSILLNAPRALKNVPLRIYVPSTPPAGYLRPQQQPHPPAAGAAEAATAELPPGEAPPPSDAPSGAFKVVQTLVSPRNTSRQPQLVGQVLRTLLPSLFPSSRDPVLANVILHGAPVPFNAPIEDLMREAAYPDGWLCLIVVLL